MQTFLQGHPTYLYNCGISIVTVISLWGNYSSTVRNHLFSGEQFFVHSLFHINGAGNNTTLTVLSVSLHCAETELTINYLNTDRPTDQFANSLTHCTYYSVGCSALHRTQLSWEHHRHSNRRVPLRKFCSDFSGDLCLRRQVSNIMTI